MIEVIRLEFKEVLLTITAKWWLLRQVKCQEEAVVTIMCPFQMQTRDYGEKESRFSLANTNFSDNTIFYIPYKYCSNHTAWHQRILLYLLKIMAWLQISDFSKKFLFTLNFHTDVVLKLPFSHTDIIPMKQLRRCVCFNVVDMSHLTASEKLWKQHIFVIK